MRKRRAVNCGRADRLAPDEVSLDRGALAGFEPDGGDPDGGDPYEKGSEVVANVLIGALVCLVVLAMLQLSFALYTRNLAISAVSEGARRAALDGACDQDGIDRTQELFNATSWKKGTQKIVIRHDRTDSGETIVVTASTTLPVFLTWGVPNSLTVEGRSLVEKPYDSQN